MCVADLRNWQLEWKLQQSKRELADAIIAAENSLIRDLPGEDLEPVPG